MTQLRKTTSRGLPPTYYRDSLVPQQSLFLNAVGSPPRRLVRADEVVE